MSLRHSARLTATSACLLVVLAASGCKSSPSTPDDAALTASSQSTLSTDTSLTGQPITVSVQNGIANLNGTVSNDAQKTLAARDIAGIRGIREVNNNLAVSNAPLASSVTSAAAPQPILPPPVTTTAPVQPARKTSASIPARRVPTQQASSSYPDSRYGNNQQQPAPVERSYPPAQTYTPPVQSAPAQPTFRTVSLPAGANVPVRITQTLDSATTQPGDTFSGTVASDVLVDGLVAIPAGSGVSGQVDNVHEAGHFKGSSLLTVSLSGVTRRGDRLPLSTEPYTVQGKGRGANTAEKTGGGAAVGAILGGIFGGGKGAAIGAAAGGGLGAGANAVTRGQQVQIPSESVIRFQLASPLTVRVRTDQTPRNDALRPRTYNNE